MKTVIIGIGNLLMGDDGVGIKVLEFLHERYTFPEEVLLIDGGTKSIELLPYLEDAQRVIFIDAVDFGREPGFVAEVSGQAVAEHFQHRLSVHQIGLPDLIGAMLFRGTVPEEMVLVGVQPQITDMQWGLTEPVQEAVSKATEIIINKLKQWNLEVKDVSCNPL